LVDVYLRLEQLYPTRGLGNVAVVFDFLLVDPGVFLHDIVVTVAQLVLVVFDSTGLLSNLQSSVRCMLSPCLVELLPLLALGFLGGRLEALSLVVPFALAAQHLCLHSLEGPLGFCAQRVVGAFFARPKGPDSLPHVYELGSVGGGLALQCRLAVLFRLLEKDSLVAN
jgi:hypothetical protein